MTDLEKMGWGGKHCVPGPLLAEFAAAGDRWLACEPAKLLYGCIADGPAGATPQLLQRTRPDERRGEKGSDARRDGEGGDASVV